MATPVFGKLMRTWSWVLLILLVILIKFLSTEPLWVERNYSNIIYPLISRVQRAMLGWIPLSVGDLLYIGLGIFLLIRLIRFIKVIMRRQLNRQYLLATLKGLIFFFLLIYVLFYGLWGLNYNRKGIAYQLGLDVTEYTSQDLDTLVVALQQRLNYYSKRVDTLNRDSSLQASSLFKKGEEAFLTLGEQYKFLYYTPRSVKYSLFSPVGHFLGVHGYYNPFSGEAQLNGSIPNFLHPFVVSHEIAHQLGYGLENEANFVGFLAAREIPDIDFRYSAYFETYFYAVRDMNRFSVEKASSYRHSLDTIPKLDYRRLIVYVQSRRNPLQPLVSRFYDGYLKANNQPMGLATYNRVVAWLIAYYKKYGIEAL